MAKFNTSGTQPKVSSPVATTGRTATALGATGFTRTSMSDLYLLAVSNLVDVKEFHDSSARARDARFVDLLRDVAMNYPQFGITKMLPWLRHEGYLRSASALGAAEVAKVLCDDYRYDGVEDMVDGVLGRADDLCEFLAYWRSIAGRSWPKRYRAVERGLKRAGTRLITEFSYGKYDSPKRPLRFADFIEIVRPIPADENQSALFRMIIANKHGRRDVDLYRLPMFNAACAWHERANGDPQHHPWLLKQENIKAAGLTWEDVMSALGSHMDKATIWEAMIPSMGIHALLKNLRNFDEAGISRDVVRKVCAVISDPAKVRKGKVFPSAFLAAYRATSASSLAWGQALEDGLTASLDTVPALKGRTLILVDRSPSMFPGEPYSTPHKGSITLADQAAVFGAALAVKAENPTLIEFGGTTTPYGQGGLGSRGIAVRKGASVLKVVDSFGEQISGTDIPRAVKDNFLPGVHDRVIIITDEQSRPGYLPSNMSDYGGERETSIDDLIPKSTPVYLWNMAGYSASILDASAPNRHCFGGLSDASFGLITMLEKNRSVTWPWMMGE